MNILLKGYYGQKNLGDDYLLYAILNTLNGCGKYKVRVVVAEKQYASFFKRFPNLKLSEMFRPWRRFTKRIALIWSDVWIIGGGGLWPRENTKNLKILLDDIRLAKKFGCKVVFYGVDINSANDEAYRSVWKEILKETDLFVVRNRKTKNILDSILEGHAIRSADLTFGLETPAEKESSKSVLKKLDLEEGNYIIWAVPMEFKNDPEGIRYRKLIGTLARLANESALKNYKHVLLPYNENKDTQLLVDPAKEIHGPCIVCDNSIDIEEKRLLYRFAKCSVSMRFHSVMFSLYHRLPGIYLSYSDKTSDVIRECGLEDFMLEYGISAQEDFGKEFDLDECKLMQLADRALAPSAEDTERIITASDRLKKMASASKMRFAEYFTKG